MRILLPILSLLIAISICELQASGCFSNNGEDLSTLFHTSYYEKNNLAQRKEWVNKKLKDYTIIMIPGIDYDLINGVYNGRHFRFIRKTIYKLLSLRGNYLDYKDLFKENKINYKTLEFEYEEDSTKDKPLKIMELIRASKKPIIFFAHSKGGVDILNALIRLKKSKEKEDHMQLDRIKGAVFMQSPFQGSPFADLFLERASGVEDRVDRLFWYLVKLDVETLKKLTLNYRKSFNREYSEFIREFSDTKNILSFSTYVDKESNNFRYLFFAYTRDKILKRYGLDNDGLIPCGSAWPGSKYIIQQGISHARPIRKATFWNRRKDIDRKKLFYTLMNLWFKENQR